jgi:hypothetical protein
MDVCAVLLFPPPGGGGLREGEVAMGGARLSVGAVGNCRALKFRFVRRGRGGGTDIIIEDEK